MVTNFPLYYCTAGVELDADEGIVLQNFDPSTLTPVEQPWLKLPNDQDLRRLGGGIWQRSHPAHDSLEFAFHKERERQRLLVPKDDQPKKQAHVGSAECLNQLVLGSLRMPCQQPRRPEDGLRCITNKKVKGRPELTQRLQASRGSVHPTFVG